MCGNFIYDLMRDKSFQKYHAKWIPDPDKDIDPSMYNCQSIVQPRRETDSLHIRHRSGIGSELDENEQNAEGEEELDIENTQIPQHNSEEGNRPKKPKQPKQPSNTPINAPKPRIEPIEI